MQRKKSTFGFAVDEQDRHGVPKIHVILFPSAQSDDEEFQVE